MEPKENNSYIKVTLINIKSKFILKKIIQNIKETKMLNIIRYNKKYQNKLNIDINDYKNKMKIIIELICSGPGKFINRKELEHFHIYINDNKEEIKSNKVNEDNNYFYEKNNNKITIIIDYEIKSFDELFKDCSNIRKISFKIF